MIKTVIAFGLFVVGLTSVQAADLCSPFNNPIYPWIFPKLIRLGLSSQYIVQDGPRTCSWTDQRTISFRCLARTDRARTRLFVVSSRDRSRNIFPVVCDGAFHTINKSEAYFGLSPPFHIYWHLNGGSWTDAYIRLA